MGIFDVLINKKDQRNNGSECSFNGLLSDFVPYYYGSYKIGNLFSFLIKHDPEVRIIFKLCITISKNSITNDIIGYKDIYKFSQRQLVVPYIIYGKKNGVQKAMIIDRYVYAKGEYFAMTEPGSEYQDFKNDIVANGNENFSLLINTYDRLFNDKAGKIQRSLDKFYFGSFEKAYEEAILLSNNLRANAFVVVDEAQREPHIKNHVRLWFLLKKSLYAQYMTDKTVLNEVHKGDIKEQRKFAKKYADSIKFIPISELWNYKNYYVKGDENE